MERYSDSFSIMAYFLMKSRVEIPAGVRAILFMNELYLNVYRLQDRVTTTSLNDTRVDNEYPDETNTRNVLDYGQKIRNNRPQNGHP